jgi:hypothetical protein
MEAKQVRELIDTMYVIDMNYSKTISISGITANLQQRYGENITYEMVYTALLVTSPDVISFRIDYPGCKLKKIQ